MSEIVVVGFALAVLGLLAMLDLLTIYVEETRHDPREEADP